MMIVAAILLCCLICFAPLFLIRKEPVRPAPIDLDALSPDPLRKVPLDLPMEIGSQTPAAHDALSPDPLRNVPLDPPTEIVSQAPAAHESARPAVINPPKNTAKIGQTFDLKKRYQWIVRLLVPFQIVLFLALAVLWVIVFHFLGEAHAAGFPASIVLFKPLYGGYFALSAIFMGIFSAAVSEAYLLRLVLGARRYAEYRHWEQARFGVHGQEGAQVLKGLFTALGLMVAVPTVLMIPLLMNWNTRFEENQIVVRPFFSLADDLHSYGSIKRIVYSSHTFYKGKLIESPGIFLAFDDGRTWEKGSLYTADRRAGIDRLLHHLQRKTTVLIERVRLREDAVKE